MLPRFPQLKVPPPQQGLGHQADTQPLTQNGACKSLPPLVPAPQHTTMGLAVVKGTRSRWYPAQVVLPSKDTRHGGISLVQVRPWV